MSELPYRRPYARVLIAVAIAVVLLFPLMPQSSGELIQLVRLIMWTYGASISSIIAPTLLYAGLSDNSGFESMVFLCLRTAVPHLDQNAGNLLC